MARRFERVAAAFDDARMRLCESSGSEYSPHTSTHHLSYLVNSFMERGQVQLDHQHREVDDEDDDEDFQIMEKRKILLEGLFGGSDADFKARQNIRTEIEIALGLVGSKSSSQFKRNFMSRLRERGFDAGLCKSKWEKNGRSPGGDYEYIDVNVGGKRYIIEVSLASEFEIARPTNQYSSLIDVFPQVFVGEVEELKQIVRLMCSAIKGSMKSIELHIPPWRRNGYMEAKWFSSYKRTTNDVSTKNESSLPLSLQTFTPIRSIGFEARAVKKSYNCRDDYVTKTGFRVSHLTAAFHVDGSFGGQL
ncbi:hypothetical protein TanjilG_26418 [Lupinus angustifolius]|uniref:DUF506 family protein n=1 Tax=Lupinus angustifolius TaxID=3871 RepID=A0A4P1R3N2_LUPAN|nr:PREDICTED: uncharacterized protein LOC109362003 [Lupinus angustifolius]OIW00081.1 hypothetical protein TanjilG_26418 [Lupinus angustifolius]